MTVPHYSLVPNIYHPAIARECISHNVNLVTASYVSPEMAALDQPARDAGITLMNEVGLDPGVDHMLAMACIDDAHSRGGKVRGERTIVFCYCGNIASAHLGTRLC